MAKKNSYIPHFKDDGEAARFWDTHDSTAYLAETQPANLRFPKPKHKVVLSLDDKQWDTLQRLANKKKTPFNRFLEKIIGRELVKN